MYLNLTNTNPITETSETTQHQHFRKLRRFLLKQNKIERSNLTNQNKKMNIEHEYIIRLSVCVYADLNTILFIYISFVCGGEIAFVKLSLSSPHL